MKLLRFLLRGAWGTALLATSLGLISGGSNAGLLVVINAALHHSATSTTLLVAGFIALGLTRVCTAGMSQFLLSVFAQKTTTRLRQNLCRQILNTPLRQLEEVGIPKLMVTLTEDVGSVSHALRAIPSMAVDGAMFVGCVVYLGWLSWPGLLGLSVFTTVGLLIQRGLVRRALRSLKLAREIENSLFQHFRALTEGIKELAIHRERRKTFLSEKIYRCTEAYQDYNLEGSKRFIIGFHWNQLFFISLVGLALLYLPAMKNVGSEALTGYVLTILYLMGPMRQLMNTFPTFARADISLDKIENLGLSLSAQDSETNSGEELVPEGSWRELELEEVLFTYRQDGREADFTLGPIDFGVRPGEIVFVVGGNGSGKSTLAKLLVGLYAPEHGTIRLNGQTITEKNREWYRQHFSVVFSDFYVFDDLLGLESANLDQRAGEYLSLLELTHKVHVNNGSLSTTALSQGQRRRLALLTAYLEDRPIYVFDEWAADQDPQYKNVFYTQLLPELKANGKAVIVITHDDRYFHLADRVIKLDYGKLVSPDLDPIALHTQNVPLAT